jgi:hypothetical protein
MPALNRFESFTTHLNEKVHNLTSDTLKFILTNDAPSAAWATKSSVTGELSTANGYTNGGLSMSGRSASSSGGVYTLTCTDPAWTASAGSFGPFRYCILYNDSPTSPADPLIGWMDFGYGITVTSGNTFTIDLPSTGFYFSS